MVCDRASKDDGVSWGTAPRTLQSLRQTESLADEFIAAGIDDLAKYHIVRMFYEQPATAGDAAYYAAYLGFHSLAVTGGLLEELAATGVLVKDAGADREPRYRLTDDGEVRRRLMRLYNSTSQPLERDAVLRLLAYRSLAKARYRAKSARRNGHSGNGHEQLDGLPSYPDPALPPDRHLRPAR